MAGVDPSSKLSLYLKLGMLCSRIRQTEIFS